MWGDATTGATILSNQEIQSIPSLTTDEAIREAILAGLGVSILSRYSLGLEPERSKLICLDVQGFPRERHWHFIYPVGKQLSVAARAFMDFARAEARSLVRDALEQPQR